MEEIPLEEQKKLLLPYLQRAQEVEKVDPKVAYYCRLYAIDQALTIPKRAKEINGLVAAVMGKLEKDKAAITLDKDQDKVGCEAFALRVFANSDRVDRAGRADAGTAKGFLAASYFLDILNQFGPLDADLTGKQKYALWRAAEISKAMREGRPPVPPPAAASGSEAGGSEAGLSAAAGADESFTMAGIKALDGSFVSAAPPPTAQPPQPPKLPVPTGPHAQGDGPILYTFDQYGQPQGAHVWGAPPPPAPPQDAAPPPPPPPPPPPAAPDSGTLTSIRGAGGPLLPGQRYKPGSPVLFCESAGVGPHHVEEPGTMAQVSQDSHGNFSYRVALKDRFVQGNDMQVAPLPAVGSPVGFQRQPGGPLQPAHVTLVNDGMGWPPTYMVSLENGEEMFAQAHQLSMVLPQDLGPTPTPAPAVAAHLESRPPPADWVLTGMGPPPGALPQGPTSNGGSSGLDSYPSAGYPSVHSQGHGGMPQPHPGPPRADGGGVSPQWSAPPAAQPPVAPTSGGGMAPSGQPLVGPGADSRGPAQHVQQATAARSQPQYASQPPMPQQAAPPGSAGYITIPALPPGFKPSVVAIAEAQKAARTAVSSLNFEDVASAVKYLTHAIEVLTTQPQPHHR